MSPAKGWAWGRLGLGVALASCEPVELKPEGTKAPEEGLSDPGPACAIRADLELDTWTAPFEAQVDCACEAEALDCWSLWRARVVAIDGSDVTLEFVKANATPLRADITAWVVDATDPMSCINLNSPAELSASSISAGREQFSVTLAPFDERELRRDGLRKALAVVTDGEGSADLRVWWQPDPIWLEIDCSTTDSGP